MNAEKLWGKQVLIMEFLRQVLGNRRLLLRILLKTTSPGNIYIKKKEACSSKNYWCVSETKSTGKCPEKIFLDYKMCFKSKDKFFSLNKSCGNHNKHWQFLLNFRKTCYNLPDKNNLPVKLFFFFFGTFKLSTVIFIS